MIGRGQIVNELTIVNMYHIFDKKKKKQKHVPYLYVKKYIYITFSPIGYELDTRRAFYILIVQSRRELQSAFLSLRTQIIMYNGGGRRRDVEGRNGGGKWIARYPGKGFAEVLVAGVVHSSATSFPMAATPIAPPSTKFDIL